MKTEAQQARQKARSSSGRYGKLHPCYVCGKSAGHNYCSDRRTDTGEFADLGLCLCLRCYRKVDAMDDETALAFLRANQWRG